MFLALKKTKMNSLFQEHKIEVGCFLYLRQRSLSGLNEICDIFRDKRCRKVTGKIHLYLFLILRPDSV